MQSRLLDMRDCRDDAFAAIHRQMLDLDLSQQPRWFRPLLKNSRALQRFTGYDHWSRAWEYPWAVLAADQRQRWREAKRGAGREPDVAAGFAQSLVVRSGEVWEPPRLRELIHK
jgi:hypothetical protein